MLIIIMVMRDKFLDVFIVTTNFLFRLLRFVRISAPDMDMSCIKMPCQVCLQVCLVDTLVTLIDPGLSCLSTSTYFHMF